MIIAGAGGLVLQMIDDILAMGINATLWADMPVEKAFLKNNFSIISTQQQIQQHFATDNRFVIGIGNPANRRQIAETFLSYGGALTSFISPKANISKFATVNQGCVVLHGAIIEAGAIIGKGCLINAGAVITHECVIGDFAEVGPAAVLAGGAIINNGCFIASNATVLPKIVVGENSIVAAGALVNRNVAANVKVAGVPAKKLNK